jgi:hypothetical protein
MTGLLVILGIVLVVGLVVVLSQTQGRGRKFEGASQSSHVVPPPTSTVSPAQDYRYTGKIHLTTQAETAFYRVLVQAVGNRGLVFAKVRVADVISPENTTNRKQWQRAFNKISAKHLDFILCEPHTLKILGAVELDDSSHNRRDRQERDACLEQALASAKVPLVRVPVQADYSVGTLANQIKVLWPPPPKPRKRPQRPREG